MVVKSSSSSTASTTKTPKSSSSTSSKPTATTTTTTKKVVKKAKGTGKTKVTRHVDQRVQARNSALNAFGGVKVDVFVRVRPQLADIEAKQQIAITVNEEEHKVQVNDEKGNPAHYSYDKVYGPESSQTDVYDDCVAPIVEQVSSGLSCCIFAYGQTGAGKTFTMRGDLSQNPDSYGIIQRSLVHLLKRLHEQEYTDIKVKCSFLEIYNESLEDLFLETKISSKKPTTKAANTLTLVDDDMRGCVCKNLSEIPVESVSQVMDLLLQGEKRARYSETKMNKLSNRAHRIFTLLVDFKRYDKPVTATLTFVDLAGSEDISKSGATGLTAREASHINKSLLTLGRVINALASNDRHIPYRDSKLTRLLSEALGGVCKTSFIACVSPCDGSFTESNNTLRYAERAMEALNISQFPRWKQDEIMIDGLTRRVQQLVDELDSANKIHKEEMQTMKTERDMFEEECKQHLRNLNRAQRKIQRLLERKSELKSGVELLNNQKRRLLNEKESLQGELLDTRSVRDGLFEDRDLLNEVLFQVRVMRNRLLDAHSLTESDLHVDANKLKDTIEGAIVDIDELHAEVVRKKGLSVHNEKVADDYRVRLSTSIRNMIQNTNQFCTSQDEKHNGIHALIADMRGTRQKETASLANDILQVNTTAVAAFNEMIQSAIDHEKMRKNRISLGKESSASNLESMKALMKSTQEMIANKVQNLRQHSDTMTDVIKTWADRMQHHYTDLHTSAQTFSTDTTSRLKQFEDQIVSATDAQISHLQAHKQALDQHLEHEKEELQRRSEKMIEDMAAYLGRMIRDNTEQSKIRVVEAVNSFKSASSSIESDTREAVASHKMQLHAMSSSSKTYLEEVNSKVASTKEANMQFHGTASARVEEIRRTTTSLEEDSNALITKVTASATKAHEATLEDYSVDEKNEVQFRSGAERMSKKAIKDSNAQNQKIKQALSGHLEGYTVASTNLGIQVSKTQGEVRSFCDDGQEGLYDTEADGINYVLQEIKRDIDDPPSRKEYVYPTKYKHTDKYENILTDVTDEWTREASVNKGSLAPGKGVDFPGERGKLDNSGLLTSTVEQPPEPTDQLQLDRAAYDSDADEYSDPEGFVDPMDREPDESDDENDFNSFSMKAPVVRVDSDATAKLQGDGDEDVDDFI
eukprot:m.55546 g.55546  ORF g.55546 m.55546 type:complete len:1149 (+) comp7756_c1_seq3:30-3476(+)